jgi:phosphate butyryltransferase
MVNGVLVAMRRGILALAEKDGLSLDGVEIVDEKTRYLAVEKSVKMVSGGDADLLMKGLVKTATLLKSVLNKEWGLRAGSLLSHLFLQEITVMGGRIFGLTDGGMNMYPDLQTKVGLSRTPWSAIIKLELRVR